MLNLREVIPSTQIQTDMKGLGAAISYLIPVLMGLWHGYRTQCGIRVQEQKLG